LRSLLGVTADPHGGMLLDLLHSHEAVADLCCSIHPVEFVSTTGPTRPTGAPLVRSSETTLPPTHRAPDP